MAIPIHCLFCGKTLDEATRLVTTTTGKHKPAICEECTRSALSMFELARSGYSVTPFRDNACLTIIPKNEN